MPIPAFDGILNVLPPHLGNPTMPSELSPYPCTVVELCERFATSTKRKEILEGFLNFREELFSLGIQGFHWMDGSFLEDIEAQAQRDPNDIDVVTFATNPTKLQDFDALISSTDMLSRSRVKATYCVDHFLVPLGSNPTLVVDNARYWYGLFSHRRGDGIWKGMLRIDLTNPAEDAVARSVLGGKP